MDGKRATPSGGLTISVLWCPVWLAATMMVGGCGWRTASKTEGRSATGLATIKISTQTSISCQNLRMAVCPNLAPCAKTLSATSSMST